MSIFFGAIFAAMEGALAAHDVTKPTILALHKRRLLNDNVNANAMAHSAEVNPEMSNAYPPGGSPAASALAAVRPTEKSVNEYPYAHNLENNANLLGASFLTSPLR